MEDDRGVQLNIPTADALSSIEEFEQKMEKKRQLRKRKHKNSLENFME